MYIHLQTIMTNSWHNQYGTQCMHGECLAVYVVCTSYVRAYVHARAIGARNKRHPPTRSRLRVPRCLHSSIGTCWRACSSTLSLRSAPRQRLATTTVVFDSNRNRTEARPRQTHTMCAYQTARHHRLCLYRRAVLQLARRKPRGNHVHTHIRTPTALAQLRDPHLAIASATVYRTT